MHTNVCIPSNYVYLKKVLIAMIKGDRVALRKKPHTNEMDVKCVVLIARSVYHEQMYFLQNQQC